MRKLFSGTSRKAVSRILFVGMLLTMNVQWLDADECKKECSDERKDCKAECAVREVQEVLSEVQELGENLPEEAEKAVKKLKSWVKRAEKAIRDDVGLVTPISPFDSSELRAINECVCLIKNIVTAIRTKVCAIEEVICPADTDLDASLVDPNVDIDVNATDTLCVIQWLKFIANKVM